MTRDQQKIVWKRMNALIQEFEVDRLSFRGLVERLMLVMDPSIFQEGNVVQTWYGHWIRLWNLSTAWQPGMSDHLELIGLFVSDLRAFISGEITKLELEGESRNFQYREMAG